MDGVAIPRLENAQSSFKRQEELVFPVAFPVVGLRERCYSIPIAGTTMVGAFWGSKFCFERSPQGLGEGAS